ncbi:translation initiation factor eIF-2B [Thermogladius sp. 4427co]|uniref:translation initiation factor eIF-2B n=1 Tax=Thermogladius sp. 4427co TaxID=3450718 RepID=UPI003F79D4E4
MSELARHGFSHRPTGSELILDLLNESYKIASAGDCGKLVRFLKEKYTQYSRERPGSAGLFNATRLILTSLREKGCTGVREEIEWLKEKYDRDLWSASEVMARRVVDGDVLMTNSNSIAVRRLFETLVRNKVRFSVYVLESRPGMEGLVLADFLDKLGVETYLVVDSAARFFMKNVDKVVSGAEAVAVNGAVISKVGTSLMALAASEARVRFFVIAPTLKISLETIYGELVRLPEGDWRLLMDEETKKGLPEKYAARVPIYDVTPPNMIDGIATELGLYPPQSIPILVKSIYGKYPPQVPSIESLFSELEKGG